jgi:chromosome partitioning protein
MKTITIANQKGGVGKSKISYNLLTELTTSDRKGILFDTDPQQSCFNIFNFRKNTDKKIIVRPALEDIHHKIDEVKNEFNFAIIDTPPHNHKTMALAVICADLVIIPVQDSPMDILSTKSTIKLIKQAQKENPNIKVYFLLSRIQPNTILSRELTDYLNNLYDIPILKNSTTNRVDYKQAMIYGLSAVEFKPTSKAAQEIILLTKEIKSILTF